MGLRASLVLHPKEAPGVELDEGLPGQLLFPGAHDGSLVHRRAVLAALVRLLGRGDRGRQILWSTKTFLVDICHIVVSLMIN